MKLKEKHTQSIKMTLFQYVHGNSLLTGTSLVTS